MLPTQTMSLFLVRGDAAIVDRHRSSCPDVMSVRRHAPKAGSR
jgi:hypothetical protein